MFNKLDYTINYFNYYLQPQLCLALLFCYFWIIYITFYNSRLLGYLLTKAVNKFYFRYAYFKIGNKINILNRIFVMLNHSF